MALFIRSTPIVCDASSHSCGLYQRAHRKHNWGRPKKANPTCKETTRNEIFTRAPTWGATAKFCDISLITIPPSWINARSRSKIIDTSICHKVRPRRTSKADWTGRINQSLPPFFRAMQLYTPAAAETRSNLHPGSVLPACDF